MPQVRIEQCLPLHHEILPSVLTVQLLDITTCSAVLSTQTWNTALAIIQFILGTAMCILVIAKFVRDLLQMHQATRKWHLNRYLSLLIREGIVYFLVYVPLFSAGIMNPLNNAP